LNLVERQPRLVRGGLFFQDRRLDKATTRQYVLHNMPDSAIYHIDSTFHCTHISCKDLYLVVPHLELIP
jgi:hypothetical protein